MKIKVEHLNDKGKIEDIELNLSYLQFIKHLAFAGMGVSKSPHNSPRFLGFMFEFVQYWGSEPDHFSIPRIISNDPTELGQISNKIGKALADFLSKKIYGAKYTHNYEDAMVQGGHLIKGERPDLYCDTRSKQFAVEAKGFKVPTVSANKMLKYKSQSQQGPVPVHFSVASVAYDLYQAPSVKFHDPIGDDVKYSTDINNKLIELYYRSILDSIELLNLEQSKNAERIPNDFIAYHLPEIYPKNKMHLLLHKSIVNGDWEQMEEFNSRKIEEKNDTYIDSDGVGLCIR
ncbi:hypothetical protein [Pseudoalteromonas sp. NZS37]|uniref:hypothetical protein n=1 Tax=Pseudoalteromonas sp. NZS37 TaxID=2792071 RepID=UPI0018CCBE2A|nr:hypothetical protein [Pseudoalteromonas sp. NZS37]MBG9993324.1 hypothetical protein [Pseudoalteromonas sp. NZS37]